MTTPPPPPAAPQNQPVSASDEKTWSILSHVGGIILNWVGPLIVFLIYKDRSPVIRQHSVAALNFQLTILIGYIVGWILTIVFIGVLVVLAASVLSIIFGIMAALAANEGRPYKYPIAIPFVK
jgi:Uncharacterized protein conserved in bacteria